MSFIGNLMSYSILLKKETYNAFFANSILHSQFFIPQNPTFLIKLPIKNVNRIALMFASFLGRIIDASRNKGESDRSCLLVRSYHNSRPLYIKRII